MGEGDREAVEGATGHQPSSHPLRHDRYRGRATSPSLRDREESRQFAANFISLKALPIWPVDVMCGPRQRSNQSPWP